MNKYLIAALGAFAFASFSMATAPASAASANGNWKRPNGTTAKVWSCGGKLCAKVTSGKKAGFNMFMSGIAKDSPNVWKGDMKHPKMGTAMTFNGTVKLFAGPKLSVKGCMIGGLFCDSEMWTK